MSIDVFSTAPDSLKHFVTESTATDLNDLHDGIVEHLQTGASDDVIAAKLMKAGWDPSFATWAVMAIRADNERDETEPPAPFKVTHIFNQVPDNLKAAADRLSSVERVNFTSTIVSHLDDYEGNDQVVAALKKMGWDPNLSTWAVRILRSELRPSVVPKPAVPAPTAPPLGIAQPTDNRKARYSAATFSAEGGCQTAGHWNEKTLDRYLNVLNEFGAKGWQFKRLDQIPFVTGCWPFIAKGTIYLMTFERFD